MYIKPRYPAVMVVRWTLKEIVAFLAYSGVIAVAYEIFEQRFLQLPWAPVAVLGTALAFILGFRNNASYGRLWEARKIWGGIVNTSRTWGMQTEAMINNGHAKERASDEELAAIHKRLVYRHIAWMSALRHAMRQHKSWEEFANQKNFEAFAQGLKIPEHMSSLRDDLAPVLSEEELELVLSKSNKQTALLYLQSRDLVLLKERKLLWEFAFLELQSGLEELFTLQGKSERIKNFPYPRQYATLSYEFLWIFWLLLPFAVVPEFSKIAASLTSTGLAEIFVWMSVPFCALISWVFNLLEKVGKFGENPFEGTANDVPISSIARTIEINLREMLGQQGDEVPKPLPAVDDIQM